VRRPDRPTLLPALASGVTLGAVLLLRDELVTDIQTAATTACAAALLSVALVIHVNRAQPFQLGTVYLGLFALFHTGLLLSLALGQTPELLNPTDATWVRSDAMRFAAVIVAISILALATAYLLARAVSRDREATRRDDPSAADALPGPDGPGVVGLLLVLVGVGLWATNVVSSGVSIVGTSYVTFLAATAATSMPTAYLLMGFGMAVVAASGHRTSRLVASAVFAAFALPGFLIGLRGEVILPLASYLVVAARRRSIRPRWWMAAVPVLALAAGSAVRVLRQTGIGSGGLTVTDFSLLSGLTELGYTIRPIVEVYRWHGLLGEPTVGLSTYLAPVTRVVVGRVLGLATTPANADPAVFSTVISQRVGPIGGSPVAEAYRSGGLLTVVIVSLLIGVVLSRLDTLPRSPVSSAAMGMGSSALFLWVRNDFTPIVAEVGLLVLVLLVIVGVESLRSRRVAHDSLAPR